MNDTTLQIPITKSLLSQAQTEALSQGFSSVEEATIAFLKKFVQKMITLARTKKTEKKFPDEILTLRQEAVLTKKWQEAKKEYDNGNCFTTNNVDEMMKWLRS
jgi:ribosomal protein L17